MQVKCRRSGRASATSQASAESRHVDSTSIIDSFRSQAAASLPAAVVPVVGSGRSFVPLLLSVQQHLLSRRQERVSYVVNQSVSRTGSQSAWVAMAAAAPGVTWCSSACSTSYSPPPRAAASRAAARGRRAGRDTAAAAAANVAWRCTTCSQRGGAAAGGTASARSSSSSSAGLRRALVPGGHAAFGTTMATDDLRRANRAPAWKFWDPNRIVYRPNAAKNRDSEEEAGYSNGRDDESLTEPLQLSSVSPIDWGAVALLFFFPALGGLLFGYDIGATSGASISLTSADYSGTDWYNLASWQTGLVVSGSLYGALLGSILAFNIADWLGRRRELIVASLVYGSGALITAFANSFALLLVGRLWFGVGIGLAMHAAPMYIAETSPPKVRGTLISLKEAFIVLGMLLGYLIGSIEIENVGGWRVMYGSASPIALVMGIGMWWLPPSPRWLLLSAVQGKGDVEQLKEQAALSIRRCGSSQASDQAVQKQVDETLSSLDGDEVTFTELFQGVNLKALKVGAGLVFFQQVTGQPSVLYYAASILQSAGFSAAADATKLAAVLGGFKLVMTGIAVFNVDKLGRRPLLITGVSGMVVSLFLLASYYSFAQGLPYLAVVALLLYVGCYQVSFGPVSWLMVSEIFPLRSRGRALSLATLVNFASNAVVAFAFAPLQSAVGESFSFVIFGVIGVGALTFIVATVPETRGLSLEEIEAKLLGEKTEAS